MQPLPARAMYLYEPELLETPEVKRWIPEDERFTQLHFQHLCYKHLTEEWDANGRFKPEMRPLLDIFNESITTMLHAGRCDLWMVLATRILLDVQGILGDHVSESYDKMLEFASEISRGVAMPRDLSVKTKTDLLGPTKAEFMSLSVLAGCYILDDAMSADYEAIRSANWQRIFDPKGRKHFLKLIQNFGKQSYRPSGGDGRLSPDVGEFVKKCNVVPLAPPDDPLSFFRQNPFVCGTVSLQLAVRSEHVGLAFANTHRSIPAVAHMYSAFKKLDLLKGNWMDLDMVMWLQAQAIFGGEAPSKPPEIINRFCLKSGFSLQMFAKNRRSHGFVASKKPVSGLKASDESEILHGYCMGTQSWAECISRLSRAIRDSKMMHKRP